jgi:hypothetical protein
MIDSSGYYGEALWCCGSIVVTIGDNRMRIALSTTFIKSGEADEK